MALLLHTGVVAVVPLAMQHLGLLVLAGSVEEAMAALLVLPVVRV
jgi:hypothetical protein